MKYQKDFEKEIQKVREDKENTERQKDAEKEKVLKLEGDMKKYNLELQNLKEEKVDLVFF